MGVWNDRRRRTLPKRQVLLKALLVEAETLQKIHVLSAKQLKRLQLEEQLLKRMLVTARNALPPDSAVLEGEPKELRAALEGIEPFSVLPSRTARQQALASGTNAAGDGTESDRQMPQEGQSAGHSAEQSQKSVGRKADGRQLEESTSGMGLSGLSDSETEPPVRKRRKLRAGTEESDDDWEAVATGAFARIADPEDPMGDLVYGQLLDEESETEQSDAEEVEEETPRESLKAGLKRAAPSASRAPQSGRRAPGKPPLPPKSTGARGSASGGRGGRKAATAHRVDSSDSDEEELGSSTVETGAPRRNPQRTAKQTRRREFDNFLSDDSDEEPGFKGLPLELDAPWEVLSRQAAAVLAGACAAGRQVVRDPLTQQPASSHPEAGPSSRVRGPARSQATAAERASGGGQATTQPCALNRLGRRRQPASMLGRA